MSVNDKMKAIADAIRAHTGGTDALTLDAMAEAIAGIQAGGGKIASGSITPLAETLEIVHNLGEKPAQFMWYPEFVTITGQTLTNKGLGKEQAIDSADWHHRNFVNRPFFVMEGNKIFSFTLGVNIDWGFATILDLLDANSVVTIYCDEEKFHGDAAGSSIIPYSESGNITLHWFAIGG